MYVSLTVASTLKFPYLSLGPVAIIAYLVDMLMLHLLWHSILSVLLHTHVHTRALTGCGIAVYVVPNGGTIGTNQYVSLVTDAAH